MDQLRWNCFSLSKGTVSSHHCSLHFAQGLAQRCPSMTDLLPGCWDWGLLLTVSSIHTFLYDEMKMACPLPYTLTVIDLSLVNQKETLCSYFKIMPIVSYKTLIYRRLSLNVSPLRTALKIWNSLVKYNELFLFRKCYSFTLVCFIQV